LRVLIGPAIEPRCQVGCGWARLTNVLYLPSESGDGDGPVTGQVSQDRELRVDGDVGLGERLEERGEDAVGGKQRRVSNGGTFWRRGGPARTHP
jgi:hypothetical protein